MEKQLPIKIYSSHSSMRNKKTVIKNLFSDFSEANNLALILAKRDINAQYRQSLLGILWAFVNPIFNTVVWIFLSNTGIVQVNDSKIPYAAFVFIGTMLWGVFTESVNAPLAQTNGSKNILSKINFPPEAVVISGIYQTLFNSLIKIGLLLIAIFCLGILPDWHILLFPIGLLVIIIVGTAIGLLVTPIGILYGDISRIIPFVLQAAMYLTPVVYPAPKSELLRKIFQFNPLSLLIENSRNWLTAQPVTDINSFIIYTIIFFVILIFSLAIYKIAMPILVERMSS